MRLCLQYMYSSPYHLFFYLFLFCQIFLLLTDPCLYIVYYLCSVQIKFLHFFLSYIPICIISAYLDVLFCQIVLLMTSCGSLFLSILHCVSRLAVLGCFCLFLQHAITTFMSTENTCNASLYSRCIWKGRSLWLFFHSDYLFLQGDDFTFRDPASWWDI